MRAVLQRVKGATVHVNGELVSRIGPGLVALIGIGTDDTTSEIEPLAKRLLSTKLWNEGQKACAINVPAQYAPSTSEEGDISAANKFAAETVAREKSSADESEPSEGSRAEEVWGGRPWRSSVQDIEGEILCVSQFTLHARLSKGTKPDFHKVRYEHRVERQAHMLNPSFQIATTPHLQKAMGGQQAREVYDALLRHLRAAYQSDRIKDGAFGEMMDVSLTNDGPVTILIDTAEKK